MRGENRSGASRAVFLDRDGTINREVNYLSHFDRFEVLPGVIDALQLIQKLGYRLFVITNQSGVAKRMYSLGEARRLNDRIQEYLAERGAKIEEFVICPHHPEGTDKEHAHACECRKPKPGMIFYLRDKYDLDLNQSYMVGDKPSDAQAGMNAGVKGILVKTGHGYSAENSLNFQEYDTLLDFAESLREID